MIQPARYGKEQTDFLVYCVEMYKDRYSLSGIEAQERFAQAKADVYVLDNFDALHTTGLEYTLDDIQGVILGMS